MGSVHHPMRKRWPFLPIGQTILSGRILPVFKGRNRGTESRQDFFILFIQNLFHLLIILNEYNISYSVIDKDFKI